MSMQESKQSSRTESQGSGSSTEGSSGPVVLSRLGIQHRLCRLLVWKQKVHRLKSMKIDDYNELEMKRFSPLVGPTYTSLILTHP